MRKGIALLIVAGALAAAATAGGTVPKVPVPALVPNAVTFSDSEHGIIGSGWQSCVNRAWHCRPSGAISVTSDGGKTWHVALDTRRPVVAVSFFHDAYVAVTDKGETFWSDSGGRSWHRSSRPESLTGYCPKGWTAAYSANIVDPNIDIPWSICVGQPAAGNESKAIYRGRRRVAYAPLGGSGGYGGISSGGYPLGIAGSHGGFGLVWESRGTLFVTRDGGSHWHGLSKLTHDGNDFGDWAYVLERGVGFALLSYGGTEKRRLIETTDAGRSWHVVHVWPCTARRQRCGDVSGRP